MQQADKSSVRRNFLKQLSYGAALAGLTPVADATAAFVSPNQNKTMAEKKRLGYCELRQICYPAINSGISEMQKN